MRTGSLLLLNNGLYGVAVLWKTYFIFLPFFLVNCTTDLLCGTAFEPSSRLPRRPLGVCR